MIRKLFPLLLFAAAVLFSGCATESPYRKFDNWALRQNAVPRHFAYYDLFFVFPNVVPSEDSGYLNWTKHGVAELIHEYTTFQTAHCFSNKVRVFAPFVHQISPSVYRKFLATPYEKLEETPLWYAVRDAADALHYYLKNYHRPGRPFILYGQGEGARILYEALKLCDDITPETGFVAAYFAGLVLPAEQIARDFRKRGIRLASGEFDTGVILAWNTQDQIPVAPGSFVVNPLNWSTAPGIVPASANVYSVFSDPDADPHSRMKEFKIPAYCGAEITASGSLASVFKPGTKHPVSGLAEYGLFTGNIVVNAEKRVRQYIYKSQWKDTLPPQMPPAPAAPRKNASPAGALPDMHEKKN